MKKVLMFIHDGYADYEASYVTSYLTFSKEAVIDTVSPDGGVVISKGGLSVNVKYALSEINDISSYDAFLLIGGRYWRGISYTNPVLKEIVGKFAGVNKIVASICDGTTYLANNHFLDHIPHSGNGLEYIMSLCPGYQGKDYYKNQQCVVSLPFITSNGSAGVEYGYAVATALGISSEENRREFFTRMKIGTYH